MIQAAIIRNRNGRYIGFECIGHAGYAEAGSDIVCAGVSTLVINTVNAVSCYTKEKFRVETVEDSGKISLRFHKPAGHDAQLLMNAMVLGLQGILQQYGAEYLTINFKEV